MSTDEGSLIIASAATSDRVWALYHAGVGRSEAWIALIGNRGEVHSRTRVGIQAPSGPIIGPDDDAYLLGVQTTSDPGPTKTVVLERISVSGERHLTTLSDTSVQADLPFRPPCPAADLEGGLYFGWNDSLFAVDRNGTLRWKRTLSDLMVLRTEGMPFFSCAVRSGPEIKLLVDAQWLVSVGLDGSNLRLVALPRTTQTLSSNLAIGRSGTIAFSRWDASASVLDSAGNEFFSCAGCMDRDVSPLFWRDQVLLYLGGSLSRIGPSNELEWVADVGVSTGADQGPYLTSSGIAVFFHGGGDPTLSLIDLNEEPATPKVWRLSESATSSPVWLASGILVYASSGTLVGLSFKDGAPEPGEWSTPHGNFRNTRSVEIAR